MSIVISIILILASIVLIVAVLMQEGNKQGLGAIGGAAETFMGKSKAKTAEGKLLMITRIVAAVFVVLAIFATWYNLRKYTVVYYDEDGNRFYPSIGSVAADDSMYQSYVAQAKENGLDEDQLKKNIVATSDSFSRGDTIAYADVPEKTGYKGVWKLAESKDGKMTAVEGELPTKMGTGKVNVIASYTIEQYTVTVMDGTNTAEDAEPLFTVTADYGTEIEYDGKEKLEEKDGYQLFYSTSADALSSNLLRISELPKTIPAGDATYYVNYVSGNFVEFFVDASDIHTHEEEEAEAEQNGEGTEAEETAAETVEYFPWLMNDANNTALAYYYNYQAYVDPEEIYGDAVANIPEEELNYYRLFVQSGTDLAGDDLALGTPGSANHPDSVGVWETEDGEALSGEMGTEIVKVYAKYYPAIIVTFEEIVPEDAAEDYTASLTTATGKEGSAIRDSQLPSKEGYTVEWEGGSAPETFPAVGTTYRFTFVAVEAEEETEEEADKTETEVTEETVTEEEAEASNTEKTTEGEN